MEHSKGSSHNFLTHRIFEDAFFICCRRYLKGRLIDIGCGTKPYGGVLESIVDEHIGVDHEQTLHGYDNIDIFGTAYNIPAKDASFDCAICTAVLEHLEEPEVAIKECYRVLRNGGYAIYSIPFFWHLHEEPRDFFRFSKYGIQYLFNKSNFRIIEILPLSGFWVTFTQMMLYYLKRFDRGLVKFFKIFNFFSWLVQIVVYKINKYDKSTRWTWMYLVVVKKEYDSI